MSTFGEEVGHDVSTKLLFQYSGGLVDPYTNHVATIMCKDLMLGPHGQRTVNAAFSNLPLFFSPDEKLTFGWGPDLLIRDYEVTLQRYDHVAFMVALAESFHSLWGAQVCHELAKSIASPTDTLPHLSQWVAILQSCNGAFASNDFGVTVEDFIRLDPYSLTYGATSGKPIPVRPKQIVAALHALAEVVKGNEKELVLTGSVILGWFAAVAEVLYDLNVAIFSSDGQALSGTKSGADPQVRIIFREKLGIEILSGSKPHGLKHRMADLGIATQQYAKSVHATPLGGRVTWQSLLPRVFGESFAHLDHEESRSFGGMVGAAARMFQGLALGESNENDLVSAQNKSNPSSYGEGLISTLTAWLPELRRFQGRMERALKLDYHASADAFVENLGKIRAACHCGICYSKAGDENEGQGPKNGYCLAVLVETIISLALALSRVTVSSGIFPSRAGMQMLYAEQVQRRLDARGKGWQDHFALIYGNEWNAPNPRRLQTCVALFSGSSPTKDLPENLVALAHEGIVAYFMKLEKASPKEEELAIIRVSSGQINVRQKLFRRACLGPVLETGMDDLWEEIELGHLDVPMFFK